MQMRRSLRRAGCAAAALCIASALSDQPAVSRAEPIGAYVAKGTVQAWAAAQEEVVRVVALGCGGWSFGSGVLMDGGRVLTNRHVVAGAFYVEVQEGGT